MFRGILSDRPPYRKFLVVVGLSAVGFIFSTLLGGLLCSLIYHINPLTNPQVFQQMNSPEVARALSLFQVIAAIGTFLLPSLFAAFLFDQQPLEYLGLKTKSQPVMFFMVLVLMIVILPFINWMMVINQHMHLPEAFKSIENWMNESEKQAEKLTEIFLATKSIPGLISNLLVIAILPAVSEEILFRGVIQKLFKDLSGNTHASIFLTALIFSAIHMQFFGFFPRFALGLLLGYLYVWSGSLWLSMFAHLVNNSMAVIFSWLLARNSLPFNPDTAGTGNGEEMVLGTSVFLTWLLVFLIYKGLAPKKELH